MLTFNEGERVMIQSIADRTGGVKALMKVCTPRLEQILTNSNDLEQVCILTA